MKKRIYFRANFYKMSIPDYLVPLKQFKCFKPLKQLISVDEKYEPYIKTVVNALIEDLKIKQLKSIDIH